MERSRWYIGPKVSGDINDLSHFESKGNYTAECKHDGEWCAIHVDFYGTNKHKFESRSGLEHEPGDIGGLVNLDLGVLGKGTVPVGELEAGTEAACKRYAALGFRRFWLYDIICVRGNDISSMHYIDRRTLLRETVWSMIPISSKRCIHLVEFTDKNFLAFYEACLKNGDEGVVIKRLNVSGKTGRSSGKTDDWIRVKPDRNMDYVVMGPDKTDGGDLTAQLGLYKNGKLTKVIKYQLPEMHLVNGRLLEEGRVVEMVGQEIFKSGAMRGARFNRWRTDKTKEMCVWE